MRLPNFRVVGDNLKDRFDGASRVMVSNSERARVTNNAITSNSASNSVHQHRDGLGRRQRYNFQLKPYNPEHKPPGQKDLVYVEPSPPFCEKNPKLGILGTHGRQCNDTSIGVDGCDLMCCGRGHRTQEVTVIERCSCTFHWCCEVKCQLCRTKKTIHTCLWKEILLRKISRNLDHLRDNLRVGSNDQSSNFSYFRSISLCNHIRWWI